MNKEKFNVCIITPAENVELAREKAKHFFGGHKALKTPVSENGKHPATFYFCTLISTEENYQRLKSMEEITEITKEEPSKFLKDRGLKFIF